MATVTHETERKYEAPPGMVLPDLRGLPRVASQSTDAELLLEATYYDTPSYDLVKAGITLRHRSGGSDAGWHLKVPSDRPDARVELRLPADPELPAEFTDLLTARIRGRALRPVAKISTRRRSWNLSDAAGDSLAEVALDDVTAEDLDRPAKPSRWSEVEVELADGIGEGDGDRLLKAADRRLRDSGLLRSRRRMKLEAVLADALDRSSREPRGRRPGDARTAAEVVVEYLATQLEEMIRRDLSVRRAEPDAVHQMRVASRRMRATLQEFRRLFSGPQFEHVAGELRWLGQELGAARDEEVLRDLLVAELDELPGESVLGPIRARIDGHFAPRLAEAQQRVREVLGSPRYLKLLDALEAFVANPPSGAVAQQRATRVLPKLVRRSQSRVRRRMLAARRAPAGGERDRALHDARKAAKRARYAAEAASLAFGRRSRKSANALKRLQTSLGDHHDAVIAAEALRSLAVRAHAEGENSYTYGILNARQGTRADLMSERARREWRRADRRNCTAWMS